MPPSGPLTTDTVRKSVRGSFRPAKRHDLSYTSPSPAGLHLAPRDHETSRSRLVVCHHRSGVLAIRTIHLTHLAGHVTLIPPAMVAFRSRSRSSLHSCSSRVVSDCTHFPTRHAPCLTVRLMTPCGCHDLTLCRARRLELPADFLGSACYSTRPAC
jgi:hypothetical protein